MEIKVNGEPPVFAKLAEAEKRHAESTSEATAQECLDLAADLATNILAQMDEFRARGRDLPVPPYRFIRHALKMLMGEDSHTADRRLIATYYAIIVGVDLP